MQKPAELAGIIASDGIASLSKGYTVRASIARQTKDNKVSIAIFQSERLEEGVDSARKYFDANPEGDLSSALIFDGYLTSAESRTDALFLKLRRYNPTVRTLTLAIPYRPTSDPRGFAIYTPQVVGWEGDPEGTNTEIMEYFFQGLDLIPEGSAVWSQYFEDTNI